MPVTSINILKSWFENGDRPTGDQFASLIDSFRHMNTKIGLADLDTGLQNTINNIPAQPASNVIVLPAGATQWAATPCLVEILTIDDNSNPVISIGSTPGGSQYAEALQLEAGEFVLQKTIRIKSNLTVYFTGTTENTIITIYKR